MRTITFFLTLLICLNPEGRAQSSAYRFFRSEEPVKDRNAYLLTVLEMDPAARAAIASSSALEEIGRRLNEDSRRGCFDLQAGEILSARSNEAN